MFKMIVILRRKKRRVEGGVSSILERTAWTIVQKIPANTDLHTISRDG